LRKEGKLPIPTEEDIENEPTALANSQYREEEPIVENTIEQDSDDSDEKKNLN